ncbi:MAG: methyltransferase domain-containing protein [Bdellovibrionaceae bacterium]|nr:methyltransferase domain-containing protein [Pseudobdellovibrionaceae bacterium]
MSSIEILKDYDVVGNYSQDEVNGFSHDVIPTLINAVIDFYPKTMLDCMAGDGNLGQRCLETFLERGVPTPELQLLEFSRVQSEIAKARLAAWDTQVWTGDVLSMKSHDGEPLFAENTFDCIMIKSANHEIPRESQVQMYSQLLRILKPGGMFINLGFAFEDENARDEVRHLAQCKDSLAGLHGAAANRYFLMKDEFYGFLRNAGFTNIRSLKTFNYNISADRVGKNYFPTDRVKYQAFKNAVASSTHLRENGFIETKGSDVAFLARGEITIAFKP